LRARAADRKGTDITGAHAEASLQAARRHPRRRPIRWSGLPFPGQISALAVGLHALDAVLKIGLAGIDYGAAGSKSGSITGDRPGRWLSLRMRRSGNPSLPVPRRVAASNAR
jgi:hypothetical protein